jgi:hypothetical protein
VRLAVQGGGGRDPRGYDLRWAGGRCSKERRLALVDSVMWLGFGERCSIERRLMGKLVGEIRRSFDLIGSC